MNLSYKTALIFLLFLGFVFFQLDNSKQTSLTFLDQNRIECVLKLSVKDKKKLSILFNHLFFNDCFAYSILGNKPLSWASYKESKPGWQFKIFEKITSGTYNKELDKGWKVWSKIKNHIQNKELIFENFPNEHGWRSILLINKNLFNSVIIANKKHFEIVLEKEIKDGLQLLQESENKSILEYTLKNHQALIGIVLGYGTNNAWFFHEAIKTKKNIPCIWDTQDENRTKSIKVRVISSDVEEALSTESIPNFAGIPNSEESIALKQEYLKAQKKVVEYYKGKDFVEATLSLLAGYQPD